MILETFSFVFRCKGKAISSICKQKLRKILNNIIFVDLCQDLNTLLTLTNTFFLIFTQCRSLLLLPLHR